ncbi:MAG: TonB-dependent receptor [Tannerellaceae bacterium]|nr:TonB-dependent receptor [Tannerellaceae bacterium]
MRMTAMAMFPFIAMAQSGLSDSVALPDVTITADAPRQVLTQSYSQTDIPYDAIEEKIATSLIDVLEQAPGITKRGEYHSPIALRGLGGKRLLITKDGNRRMGNFSGGFMGQSVNVYDLAKVEIIKGPASVQYGPGAISGIINMESKPPFLRRGIHGKALSSYGTNNAERNVLTHLAWANLDHALTLSARYRSADDYHKGHGEVSENSSFTDKDLRAAYHWEGYASIALSAEAEYHDGGPWGHPRGFNGTMFMRMYNPYDNTFHSAVTLRWLPERCLRRLETSIYYDHERRQQRKDSYDVGSGLLSYREDVNYRNGYGGYRLLSRWALGACELSAGSDGVLYRIESPTEATDYFLDAYIRNRVSKDAGVMMGGIFAENEYISGNWKLRGGLRTDGSVVNEGAVHDTTLAQGRRSTVKAWNGVAGLVYTVAEEMFASLQVARSCRMPDAMEMFIIRSASDGIVYGNPALTPEYGLNLDAGLRGNITFGGLNGATEAIPHPPTLVFDLSLFANFLNEFISQEYWRNSGKKGINYTYLNIERARIYGAELSLTFLYPAFLHPDNRLAYNATFVYTQGDKLRTNDQDNAGWLTRGDPLRTIPPFNCYHEVNLRHILNSGKSFYLSADSRYYASQHRIAPSSEGGYVSPAYALFGISAGFTCKRRLTFDFKLRLDNLADNAYRPFETIVQGMGRTAKFLFSSSF